MIPYRDTVPVEHTPWITWILIGLNLIAYVYTSLLPPDALRHFQYLHGLMAARYVYPDWAAFSEFPENDYTPFITSLFLHGSALHLILNLWLLWIFGDNIEDRMGGIRFLAFYLLCGIIAGAAHVMGNPQSIVPAVGASGAIAGILGAYFFLFPFARIVIWLFFLPLFVEIPAIAFLGIWVIIQLYNVTTGLTEPAHSSEVAWIGHLGGFSAGLLLHPLFLLRDRYQGGSLLGR